MSCFAKACALLATTWAASTSGAYAQAPETEARRLFDEGFELTEAGELQEALRRFEASAAIMERPVTVFNIAKCNELLGRNQEAVTHYQRFLNLAPADDPRRPEADAALLRLGSGTPADAPVTTSRSLGGMVLTIGGGLTIAAAVCTGIITLVDRHAIRSAVDGTYFTDFENRYDRQRRSAIATYVLLGVGVVIGASGVGLLLGNRVRDDRWALQITPRMLQLEGSF